MMKWSASESPLYLSPSSSSSSSSSPSSQRSVGHTMTWFYRDEVAALSRLPVYESVESFPYRRTLLSTVKIWRTLLKSCWKCDKKDSIKRCTGCRISVYCSVECQRRDWLFHKKFCSQFKLLSAGSQKK